MSAHLKKEVTDLLEMIFRHWRIGEPAALVTGETAVLNPRAAECENGDTRAAQAAGNAVAAGVEPGYQADATCLGLMRHCPSLQWQPLQSNSTCAVRSPNRNTQIYSVK